MFSTIILEKHSSHNSIILNRKEALNAINEQMINELHSAIDISREEEKHIVFTGYDNVFSAGGDIKLMSNLNTQKDAENISNFVQNLMNKIENYPFLTIALINGICFGGGVELAISCDFIFATYDSKFAMPELKFNIIPGGGGSVRLSEKIGYSKTLDLILTGKQIDSNTAKEIGLVDKTLKHSDIENAIDVFFKNISDINPQAIKLLKESLKAKNYKTESRNFGKLLSKYGADKIKQFLNSKNEQ